ncbi:hypothetical protein ACXDF8_24580 [Mycolicibacterium sp. CBM1]
MTGDVRMVWSAEPGIDLTTGPAVVVRAYIESYFLASSMGTLDVAYPGFSRALPAKQSSGEPASDDPWPDTNYPVKYPLVGTNKDHILRVDNSGETTVAVVCDFAYGVGFDLGDGSYGHDSNFEDDGVGTIWMKIVMTSQPPSAQRGPAAAPTTDIFNGAQISGRLVDIQRDTPQWPTREADAQACRDRAPDPKERRTFLWRNKHPRSDYPTLPPYPGWPAAGPS